jgi:hypothetical protein
VQSPSVEHEVLHEVPIWHVRLPGHGVVVPFAQLPAPSQVLAAVSIEPVQEGAPQAVPATAWWHTPPAAQVPSVPHGGLGAHWPVGAAVPAT